jgi:hypothetical protein
LFLPCFLSFWDNFYSIIFDEYKGDFRDSIKILFRVKEIKVGVGENKKKVDEEVVVKNDEII